MSNVRVLVGTKKGAFVLTSDGKRENWDVSGPLSRVGSSTTSKDRPPIQIGSTRHSAAAGLGRLFSAPMTEAKRGRRPEVK